MTDEPLAHANAPARVSETLPPSEADYDAICAAVMETSRGRWFLAEYARRNRQADTQVVLSAIERLESVIRGEPANQSIDRVRFDLMEMAKAIARTKREIAAIKPDAERHGRIGEATEELDSIVQMTERATSEILAASEQIQEIAWTMREQGIEVSFCDQLDARATDIYTSCSFQDLTGQRIHKVIEAMRYLENRINAMIEIWGGDVEAAAEPSPAEHMHDPGLDQADIDSVMAPAPEIAATDFAPIAGDPLVEGPGTTGPAEGQAVHDVLAAPPAPSFFGESELLAAQLDSLGPDSLIGPPVTPDDAQPVFDVTPMPEPPLPTDARPITSAPVPPDLPPAPAESRSGAAASAPVKPLSAASSASDPLAAIEALSDEEKIALFS